MSEVSIINLPDFGEFEDVEVIEICAKEGQKVEHLRFGRGKIIKIEGVGPSKKAVISFNNHGEKQILLKFAKLKIVG